MKNCTAYQPHLPIWLFIPNFIGQNDSMKKTALFFLCFAASLLAYGQKKKSKDRDATNYEVNDSIPPAPKDSKKGKGKNVSDYAVSDSLPPVPKDSRKGKSKKVPVRTEYISVGEETPVADTATKFTGIIKYRMTSDDPAERDSMIIYYGENHIRVTMFIPGYRADQIFEQTSIARFSDSTLITLEPRTMTYRTEHLAARNGGTEFTLLNHKKSMNILGIPCPEYSGEMLLKDGESYEAAALVSKQHSYLSMVDYNFLNIQPLVLGYRIVLGWRTKSSDGENSYIIAYKIEKGNVENYFDLTGYRPK